MRKIVFVLAIAAMVVSSCGTKTNTQKEEVKTEQAPAKKACCAKDDTKADAASCTQDSTACKKECTAKAECPDKKECTAKTK